MQHWKRAVSPDFKVVLAIGAGGNEDVIRAGGLGNKIAVDHLSAFWGGLWFQPLHSEARRNHHQIASRA